MARSARDRVVLTVKIFSPSVQRRARISDRVGGAETIDLKHRHRRAGPYARRGHTGTRVHSTHTHTRDVIL